jgi:hypothetical protein
MRMNQLFFSFAAAVTLFSFAAEAADDLEALAGKWSVKKVSKKGTQTYKPEENWHYTIRWHLK